MAKKKNNMSSAFDDIIGNIYGNSGGTEEVNKIGEYGYDRYST